MISERHKKCPSSRVHLKFNTWIGQSRGMSDSPSKVSPVLMSPVPPVPNLFATQLPARRANAVVLPPIQAHATLPPSARAAQPPLSASVGASARWAFVRKNKKLIIKCGSAAVGHRSTLSRMSSESHSGSSMLAVMQHKKARELCKSTILLYLPESDHLAAFDSWLGVLSFIQKEKPASWWLDSLQPPDYEMCKNGARIRDEKTGKIDKICSSFMDTTGCDADMMKLLCPWMVQHVWEDDNAKESKIVFNSRTPRDQYSISESLGAEVMLVSLNLPVAGTSITQSSFPKHPVVPLIKPKTAANLAGSIYAAQNDKCKDDRTCDMPVIMLRGKHFFVTYGWAPNNLCLNLRTNFVNFRAHAHSVGLRLRDVALDEIFARAFELGVAEVEDLVDASTASADKCDDEQFTTDEISQKNDSDASMYLRTVYDNIVTCNRLIRSLLPKKAVFTAIEQGTWPDYITKSCAQRLEASVAVFSYLEARASSNVEQLKSLQDNCLSMINLGLAKQGTAMNTIMQRFAVVTIIFAPLTLATGFFGMNVPIPGPSMNPDDHDRFAPPLTFLPAAQSFYRDAARVNADEHAHVKLSVFTHPLAQQLRVLLGYFWVRFFSMKCVAHDMHTNIPHSVSSSSLWCVTGVASAVRFSCGSCSNTSSYGLEEQRHWHAAPQHIPFHCRASQKVGYNSTRRRWC